MKNTRIDTNSAYFGARQGTHVVYNEDLRCVEQNPGDDWYHFLLELLFAQIHPQYDISVVEKSSDEYKRYRHRKENLQTVRFIHGPGGPDQLKVNLPFV